ncbi:hypothetical protein BGX23_009213 [Mortierella sp. AD031]|nr:hypothetical protein BGX23_009213 [Mortierella sp. AD031]KAG0203222.1 hypothetical protein BGX33_009244 [Mortierella sp. NVP41]
MSATVATPRPMVFIVGAGLGGLMLGGLLERCNIPYAIFERASSKDLLPKSNQENLPFSCTCLVGQTEPLDTELFPEFKNPQKPFSTCLGKDKPYTWTLFTTAQNTICWMVLHHLDKTAAKEAHDQRFRNIDNSEWDPHAAQAMCDETSHFPISFGGGKMTLKDLYNRTPKDRIAKVMLEEKIFRTWHHGRIVFLGDACHKVNLSGGLGRSLTTVLCITFRSLIHHVSIAFFNTNACFLIPNIMGAISAMHDAIALANLIYALPSNTAQDIDQSFKEYHTERLPAALAAYNNSLMLSELLKVGVTGALA